MSDRSNKFTDPYVTIAETAEYLGLTDRAVRQAIADGRLKAHHLGPRIIRLKISEIDAALMPYGGEAGKAVSNG
jgi:excisionase family DNA binding protein